MLHEYDKSFIENHQKLIEMSDELTSWEAQTRYGEDLISTREKINYTLSYADKLLSEAIKLKEEKEIDLDTEEYEEI